MRYNCLVCVVGRSQPDSYNIKVDENPKQILSDTHF